MDHLKIEKTNKNSCIEKIKIVRNVKKRKDFMQRRIISSLALVSLALQWNAMLVQPRDPAHGILGNQSSSVGTRGM